MAGPGSRVVSIAVILLVCVVSFHGLRSTSSLFTSLVGWTLWGGYEDLPVDVDSGLEAAATCCDVDSAFQDAEKDGRCWFSLDEFHAATAAARAGIAREPSSRHPRHAARWRNCASNSFTCNDNRSSSRRVGWSFTNVLDFGAVGDNMTDDTLAFKRAIDVACDGGAGSGGVLYVPPGKTFLIKGGLVIDRCDHLTVKLDGLLRATPFPDQWPKQPTAFLHFIRQRFLTISGSGVIEGEGQIWWAQYKAKLIHHRPALVVIEQSVFVNVLNISLLNSPLQHLTVHNCTDVIIDNIIISSPFTSPNTDGIHISWCGRVWIENGYISNGDDCVSITRIAFDIFVKNMVFVGGHGASIGSLGYKSQEAAVLGVTFENIIVRKTKRGARVKSWQGKDGFAYDIVFNNFSMTDVLLPICINQFYCEKHPCKEYNDTSTDIALSSITFSNIRGTAVERWRGLVGLLACSNVIPCHSIKMENIELSLPDKYERLAHFHCYNAFGVSRNVTPQSCLAADGEYKHQGNSVLQLASPMPTTAGANTLTSDRQLLRQVMGDNRHGLQQHKQLSLQRMFGGGPDAWLLDDELALVELIESC